MADGSQGLSIGEVVDGRFRVDARIAAGGMGEVYRAQQLNVDRAVALKRLRAERVGDEAAVDQFLVEATAVSRLTSPHTVTLYDVGRFPDGSPFIAMELLEGQTLRARLAQGPLDGKEAGRILDEIALSLAEAHARGIVHRDLKPSNVMLVDTPGHHAHVKVVDFGLARLDATAPTRVAGTPRYMAPEALGAGEVTARADVYALGMIAHELFAGLHPFAELEGEALAKAQLTEVPPVLDAQGLPPEVVHLIAQALAKPPRLRPADAGVFRRRWREALGRDAGPTEAAAGASPGDDTTIGPTNDPAVLTPASEARSNEGERPWRIVAVGALAIGGAALLLRALSPGAAPSEDRSAGPAASVASSAPHPLASSAPDAPAPATPTEPSAAPEPVKPSAPPAPERSAPPPPPIAPPRPTATPPKSAAPATPQPPPAAPPAKDPCRAPDNPRCYLFGACTTVDGTCRAMSSADCRASDNCAINGACTASGGKCHLTSSADCALTDECRIIGDCRFDGGKCVK